MVTFPATQMIVPAMAFLLFLNTTLGFTLQRRKPTAAGFSISSPGTLPKRRSGSKHREAQGMNVRPARSKPSVELRTATRLVEKDDAVALVARRDVLSAAAHLLGCIGAAASLSAYEDYDCANLKPLSGTIRHPGSASAVVAAAREGGDGMRESSVGAATRGMGRGASDRARGLYEYYYGGPVGGSSGVSMRDVESYNEIMERHRSATVPRWRRENVAALSSKASSPDSTPFSEAKRTEIIAAVQAVYNSLRAVQDLKTMAASYEWDLMTDLLRKPVLTSELEESCSTLRGAKGYISDDGRAEIGFNWGSCAWRHCGAHADAQEALAELYNSVGLFEPFECLFCLDIVERSLRDVLAVVPAALHPFDSVKSLGRYEPYIAQGEAGNGFGGSLDEMEGNPSIDYDFLNTLSGLRNDLS